MIFFPDLIGIGGYIITVDKSIVGRYRKVPAKVDLSSVTIHRWIFINKHGDLSQKMYDLWWVMYQLV